MKSTGEIKNDPNAATVATPYEPTRDERAAMQVLRGCKNKTPRVKAVKTKAATVISLDHPDPLYAQALLMQALGTR